MHPEALGRSFDDDVLEEQLATEARKLAETLAYAAPELRTAKIAEALGRAYAAGRGRGGARAPADDLTAALKRMEARAREAEVAVIAIRLDIETMRGARRG